MKIFKCLPALVALAFAVASLILAVLLTVWPALAATVSPEAYPVVVFVLCGILIMLHYEKLIEDAAGLAAGTTPASTVAADLKAAVSEGFGTVIAALTAQAKADLAPPPAPAPSVLATAAELASDIAKDGPAVVTAAAAVVAPAQVP